MKKQNLLFTTFLSLCIITATNLHAQTFSWVKQLGGSGNESINSITTDASGNVYTCGSFQGTVDFDPGAGIFNLTAAGNSDIYISKINAAGNFVWSRQIGGSGNSGEETATGVAVGLNGSVYIIGRFNGQIDFDPGAGVFNLTTTSIASGCPEHYDAFILKLNSSGDFMWAGQIGGYGTDYAEGLALGANDDIYISGDVGRPSVVDGNGNPVAPQLVDFDPNSGTNYYTGSNAAFVLKLDSSANFNWVSTLIGSSVSGAGCSNRGGVFGRAVAVDNSGNVFCTGDFGGTVDFDPGPATFTIGVITNNSYVLKLNGNGTFAWAKHFGGSGGNHCFSKDIAVDASSNVYTTGWFDNTIDFNPGSGTNNLKAPGSPGTANAFVSKLNASGNYVWARQMGGNSFDEGRSIDLDAAGNIYTTGVFNGSGDFDPGSAKFNLSSSGGSDAYISKLNTSGNFAWAVKLGSTLNDRGYGLDVDAAGNVVSTGTFEGTADFNPSNATANLTAIGGSDVYIHKMSQVSLKIGKETQVLNHKVDYLFPNPSKGNVTLVLMQDAEDASIHIYNLAGQLVKIEPHVFGNNIPLDLTAFKEGIYFIEVTNGETRTRLKVVKSCD
jgi:hypothetical protein